MKTEVSNSFSHGFVLTEQELQRIHNLIIEQTQAVSDTIYITYELKVKNGSIIELNSLEELFLLDNIGATAIKRLKITVADKKNYSSYKTFLEFRDADAENATNSIEYRIIAKDRTWVSVTTSKLEERINKIKRLALNQLITNKFRYILLSITFTVATMLVSFLVIKERHQTLLEPLISLESQWKNGKITDPVEAILLIEKAKIRSETELLNIVPFIYLFLLPIPLVTLVLVWQYCFPPYNFCWGEYLTIFDRRRNVGIFLMMAIIFVFAVVVIANCIMLLFSIGN
ncbi:hypothetical protein [Lyngbya aestuarii]|uniref:hypothetical protein n=1 Tax=Lyngbya aestuarii TaxID=118322 RepID=UPI00403DD762